MDLWTLESLTSVTHQFESLAESQKESLLSFMNSHFPPPVYERHLQFRHEALNTMSRARNTLSISKQHFPSCIDWKSISSSPAALKNHALIFTAGGEGERLRLSLLKMGIAPDELQDFTKATFRLPDFYKNFGTLHVNLTMVASFCSKFQIDIPVIVTTGPEDSITARVIPQILEQHNNFGLTNIKLVAQDERIHFSADEKVVYQITDGVPRPLTHPDETGGPLMKLKQKDENNESVFDWLTKLGCSRSIVVQATALYDMRLLPLMAEALKGHDCLGVGILRNSFPSNDPYGTFVTLSNSSKSTTMILEQDVRNDSTRELKDPTGKYYLPFNTGFYAFENSLLINNDLPHFATPPKEVLPGMNRSSKIGYAATDIIPIAGNPVILAIEPEMFGVLKTADDLQILSDIGKRYGLDKLCKEKTLV